MANLSCSGEASWGCLPANFFDLGTIPVRIQNKSIKLNLKNNYVEIPQALVDLRGVIAAWPNPQDSIQMISNTSTLIIKTFTTHLVMISMQNWPHWVKERKIGKEKGKRKLTDEMKLKPLNTVRKLIKILLNRQREGFENEERRSLGVETYKNEKA